MEYHLRGYSLQFDYLACHFLLLSDHLHLFLDENRSFWRIHDFVAANGPLMKRFVLEFLVSSSAQGRFIILDAYLCIFLVD